METLALMLVGKMRSQPRRFLFPVALLAAAFSVFAAFVLTSNSGSSAAGQILLAWIAGLLWLFAAHLAFRVRTMAKINNETQHMGDQNEPASMSPLLWSAVLTPYNDVSRFQFLAASSDGLMIWKVDSLYRERILEAARANQNPAWIKQPSHLFTWDKVHSITSKSSRLSVIYSDLGGKQKRVRLDSSPSSDQTVLGLSELGWEVSGAKPVQVAGKSVTSVIVFAVIATVVCGALFLSVSDLLARIGLAAAWLLGVPLIGWLIWTDKTVKPQDLEAVPVSPTRPRATSFGSSNRTAEHVGNLVQE